MVELRLIASALQAEGRGFESLSAHKNKTSSKMEEVLFLSFIGNRSLCGWFNCQDRPNSDIL